MMNLEKFKLLLALVTLFIVTLVGHGLIWRVHEARMRTREHRLTVLERRIELRQKMNDIQLELIPISAEYLAAREGKDGKDMTRSLPARIRLLTENFIIFERELAKLENREPRRDLMTLYDFIPPPQPSPPVVITDSNGNVVEVRSRIPPDISLEKPHL